MDEIVKQALAKWPNVPHCYGWLALDARGNWRMRDERAQKLELPGDKIVHSALLGFINRNYGADAHGCQYFQNGPQRVYVDLEATPYIARTDPVQGLLLHTGEALKNIGHTYLTDKGQILLESGNRISQLDDRDAVHCLNNFEIDSKPVTDEALLAWMDNPETCGNLRLRISGQAIPVSSIDIGAIPARFGFVRKPQPQ